MPLQILIPAYNEEAGIGTTVNRALAVLPKIKMRSSIVVVDDGSTDATAKIAKSLNVHVISMGRNLGKGAALKEAVKQINADFIAIVDADGSYPPEEIPDMLSLLLTSRADLVIGSRFLGEIRGGLPLLNRVGNKFFSRLISTLTGVKVTDGSSGLRVFRRKLLEELDVKARGLDFEVEMTTLAAKRGYKIVEIPIIYQERMGKSKLKRFRDGYKFFKAILRAYFQ